MKLWCAALAALRTEGLGCKVDVAPLVFWATGNEEDVRRVVLAVCQKRFPATAGYKHWAVTTEEMGHDFLEQAGWLEFRAETEEVDLKGDEG